MSKVPIWVDAKTMAELLSLGKTTFLYDVREGRWEGRGSASWSASVAGCGC